MFRSKQTLALRNILIFIKEPKNRRYITKFKNISHKLKIESGRYTCTRPITPLNERICDRCDKHEVDDEIHFFNHCTHFLEARKTLFDLINKSNVNFQSLSSFQNKLWIFNCENIAILNLNLNLNFSVSTPLSAIFQPYHGDQF